MALRFVIRRDQLTSTDLFMEFLLDLGNADDAGFLESLALQLTAQNRFDANRTYLCGHSNGGFMAYHLARRDQGIFKAFASVCGTISGADWDSLSAPIPTDFLQICGTADNVIPMWMETYNYTEIGVVRHL